MATLQAIIFDVDGTLADTEEIHRQAFNLAFTEFKLEWQWSPVEYHDLLAISGGRERIRRYLIDHGSAGGDPEICWGLAGTVHRRKSEIYRELLSAGDVCLRPGIERLIDEARQRRVRLGIATSSSRKNFETLLHKSLGDDVIGEVSRFKRGVGDQGGLARAGIGIGAGRSVAIEDTSNGNLSALRAGLSTVITTHAFTRDSEFPGASLVINQLGEPDRPYSVIEGDARGSSWVDIDLLQDLISRPQTESAPAWQAAVAAK